MVGNHLHEFQRVLVFADVFIEGQDEDDLDVGIGGIVWMSGRMVRALETFWSWLGKN